MSEFGLTKNLSNSYGEEKIRSLFNSIVKRYDLINTIMSAGAHHRWRKLAVEMAEAPSGGKALDVCCGTGDFTVALKKRMGEDSTVFGIDFAPEMIEFARRKLKKKGLEVTFTEGNALELPFEDGLFDIATIGFGMRNLVDIGAGLNEIHRVLTPGGRIAVLEIVNPQKGFSRFFFSLWFDRIVPVIGRLIHGNRGPYDYLPQSVKYYPSPPVFAAVLEKAGFNDVIYKSLGGGIIAIHVGKKI